MMQLMGITAAPDGRITLAGVAPGRYRLTPQRHGATGEPQVIEVRPGEETRVELRVP
jgi:hypothetical protein